MPKHTKRSPYSDASTLLSDFTANAILSINRDRLFLINGIILEKENDDEQYTEYRMYNTLDIVYYQYVMIIVHIS